MNWYIKYCLFLKKVNCFFNFRECYSFSLQETAHIASVHFDQCWHMYIPWNHYTSIFTTPKYFLKAHLQSTSPSASFSRQPLICILSSEISSHFLELYINGIMQYMFVLCLACFTYFEIICVVRINNFLLFFYPFTSWWVVSSLELLQKKLL